MSTSGKIETLDQLDTTIEDLVSDFTKPSTTRITFNDSNENPLSKFSSPAPNIIEWATRPEFLNFIIIDEATDKLQTVYDHYGQFEVLRDYFELLCPICSKASDRDSWGKTRMELEGQPLLVWNKEYKDDQCPKCRTTRQELNTSNMFNNYDTMLLIVGMRAGKSTTAGQIASYVEHRLLNYESPQQLFVQAPRQLFEVSFVATTGKQAEKTVYEAFTGLRDNSPWIQNYISTLKSTEAHAGQFYKENTTSIKYNHINVLFESLTSNSGGIAGGTRIAVFIDELSRFDSTESKRSAKEIYRVLNQGLKTVRSIGKTKVLPNAFGKLAATTSPISVTDYAMATGKKAGDLKNMYFVHKPTWEFNPFQPRENFDDDFKLDPLGAERDFGANPPHAENPLILDPERFMERAVDPEAKPVITFRDELLTDPNNREYIGKRINTAGVTRGMRHVLVADAGKSKDSFAMACAHGEWREDIHGEQVWSTIFDFVLTIRPTPDRIVHFDSAKKLILAIAERIKIDHVRLDRWQSESILQDLRFEGKLDADTLSIHTKAEYYVAYMQDAYEGKVHMLPPEIDDEKKEPYIDMSDAGRALHEFIHLERSIDLKKVDHKTDEHNDLAVVCTGCHHLVQDVLTQNPFMKRPGKTVKVGAIARFSRW